MYSYVFVEKIKNFEKELKNYYKKNGSLERNQKLKLLAYDLPLSILRDGIVEQFRLHYSDHLNYFLNKPGIYILLCPYDILQLT